MPYQRFILIDDNEADNFYHEIMIRRAGFAGDILVFESGVDALAFFRQDDLSVSTCIFLDINMPMMDGFEMAEQATPLLTDKPSWVMLMLTSSGSPADRERAGALPIIKGYITKPLDVATVQAMMSAGSTESAGA